MSSAIFPPAAVLLLLASSAPCMAHYEGFDSGPLPAAFATAEQPWIFDTTRSNSGGRSLRSAPIDIFQSSDLTWSVDVPRDAELSFRYFFRDTAIVSFELYVDGVRVRSYAGTSWKIAREPLTAGHHELRWHYTKQFESSQNGDGAWIDDLAIVMPNDPEVRADLGWVQRQVDLNRKTGVLGGAIRDLDGDGRGEALLSGVSASSPYWFRARWQNGALRPDWDGPNPLGVVSHLEAYDELGETRIAVANETRLTIYRPWTGGTPLVRSIPLPTLVKQFRIADVDADGDLEVVTVGDQRVRALDFATGAVLWTRSFDAPSDPQLYNVEVADFSADAGREIALIGSRTLLLSGTTGATLWTAPGFGSSAATVLDIDGDAFEELVRASGTGVEALDFVTQTAPWALTAPSQVAVLTSADIDGDGTSELVVGGSDVRVFALPGRNQVAVQPAPGFNPVDAITTGDLDGDGRDDLVISFDGAFAGESAMVWRPASGQPAWTTVSADFHSGDTCVADLDGDGALDIAYALRARVVARRMADFSLLWASDQAFQEFGIGCGQLDADPAIEVADARSLSGGGELVIRDGSTGLVQQRLSTVFNDPFPAHPRVSGPDRVVTAPGITERRVTDWSASLVAPVSTSYLATAQLDADAALEIVASDDSALTVIDADSHATEWSDAVAAGAATFVDGDSRRIAVGRTDSVYVYDAAAPRPIARFSVRSTPVAVWTARLAGEQLVLALGTDGVIEVFSLERSARIVAALAWAPAFGTDGSSVIQRTGPSSVSLWGTSPYALHRLDLSYGPVPLFADGFE